MASRFHSPRAPFLAAVLGWDDNLHRLSSGCRPAITPTDMPQKITSVGSIARMSRPIIRVLHAGHHGIHNDELGQEGFSVRSSSY